MIELAEEVREALAAGGPVVALETTLVAHGFPAPEGVEVALESERRVRAAGAVPATIGVLDGAVRVGLGEDELARFGAEARKCGPRDLAAAAVQGAVGATTVGGTLAVAARPGSASWAPAASAASTAASPILRTSPPTSASWRGRRCWSSPPA